VDTQIYLIRIYIGFFKDFSDIGLVKKGFYNLVNY